MRRLTPARLRLFLGLLLVAVSVPTAVLIVHTQRQIKWEAYYQYRSLADELGQRIDGQLQRLISAEEARGYADYRFLVLGGDPARSSYVQRSPLAEFPVRSDIPGLLGYFQVDTEGTFSTPLFPDASTDSTQWGLSEAEVAQRSALRDQLLDVLSRNRLVQQRRGKERAPAAIAKSAPASPTPFVSASRDDAPRYTPAQEAFDTLNAPVESARQPNALGQLKDLKIERDFQDEERKREASGKKADMEPMQKAKILPRAPRKEQSALLEPERGIAGGGASIGERARVRMFESAIDPFDFVLLDSGHFVLFRKVWRNGQRTIQGAIIEQAAFLRGALSEPFQETALAQMSNLVVAYQGDVLILIPGRGGRPSYSSAEELEGTQLYQTRLSAPLGKLQLLWTINRLPASPGAGIVTWTSLVLSGVLTLGFFALYRLGLRQITLARQQQDFVSAVSHELKTPLTSIRMYGEMLREGWVSEEKKREYYDFIHDESERLSRLIANVLQLARMERNDLRLDLKNVRVATLMQLLRSKVNGQIKRAGFQMHFKMEEACAQCELQVDADAFIQIIINLVDNALKFSARAENKTVDISVRPRGTDAVIWSVRDYGPGVPQSQMKKIFQLFYRPGSELTRETVGTGIGLALVRQLARAMGGEVDALNREPGAEFEVMLPVGEA
jgi:signal transduction histidine kinase